MKSHTTVTPVNACWNCPNVTRMNEFSVVHETEYFCSVLDIHIGQFKDAERIHPKCPLPELEAQR